MSADNVTPIRAGDGSNQPPTPPRGKPRKARAKTPGVHLRESDKDEGFATYEVLAGLRGVCDALDDRDYTRYMDIDLIQRLAMAAKVLASLLHEREECDEGTLGGVPSVRGGFRSPHGQAGRVSSQLLLQRSAPAHRVSHAAAPSSKEAGTDTQGGLIQGRLLAGRPLDRLT